MFLRPTGKFLTDDEQSTLEDLKRRAHITMEDGAASLLQEAWRKIAKKRGLPQPNRRDNGYAWNRLTGEIMQLSKDALYPRQLVLQQKDRT